MTVPSETRGSTGLSMLHVPGSSPFSCSLEAVLEDAGSACDHPQAVLTALDELLESLSRRRATFETDLALHSSDLQAAFDHEIQDVRRSFTPVLRTGEQMRKACVAMEEERLKALADQMRNATARWAEAMERCHSHLWRTAGPTSLPGVNRAGLLLQGVTGGEESLREALAGAVDSERAAVQGALAGDAGTGARHEALRELLASLGVVRGLAEQGSPEELASAWEAVCAAVATLEGRHLRGILAGPTPFIPVNYFLRLVQAAGEGRAESEEVMRSADDLVQAMRALRGEAEALSEEFTVEERSRHVAARSGQLLGQLEDLVLLLAESVGRDVAESAGPDVVESAGRDVAESAGRDVAESAGRDVAESAGRDVAESAGPDVAESAGRDVAESAGPDVAESAGRDVAEQGPSLAGELEECCRLLAECQQGLQHAAATEGRIPCVQCGHYSPAARRVCERCAAVLPGAVA